MPLVFWHGAGQFSKTWETTPDGREGFQTIFLRRRFPVYVLDQPRRGNAGRSTVSLEVSATPDDQIWYGMFRFGLWPNYFPGVQLSHDPEALNQFFRSMTPNTGPYDAKVNTDAVSALFDKIGPGILVTHSQGGGPGWLVVMKNPKVRAVATERVNEFETVVGGILCSVRAGKLEFGELAARWWLLRDRCALADSPFRSPKNQT